MSRWHAPLPVRLEFVVRLSPGAGPGPGNNRPAIGVLLVLRFPFPESRWREHVDAPKRIQDQEILVAGDNRGALASHCGRQHDIVVAVPTRWGIEGVRRHERERLGKQLNGGPHINRALAELPFEDFTELVQQELGRNDSVLADAVFEEIAAGAARDEGGDQHVRIQDKFHDTRVNTSSSV